MLVVGLSLVGSVQRLVVVGRDVPVLLAVGSEVVVLAARVLLVVLVWRLAFRGVSWGWGNVGRFVRTRWRALVLQVGLLSVAFLVFDVGAEALVGRDGLALLLFLKNPTVIALTVIWWVGLLRQILTNGQEPAPGTSLEWNVPSGKGFGSDGR
ncbi:hypothetical protein ACFFQW_06115 [Umezawaea endophytica]|uniref:Uncharacterized protein n=1 Tax=Umezawaea endophytica TaxID=1654476 RepID=A0A9X3AH77_9PSEU|nr:hypothetical protein [Umezawaea endophytica]MCS7481097.1 hypothetical protein [Umezawaea endophytica]